ncbi:protein SMG7 [Canna indica]|uniref:Protein SMG7 n=1 Tax=Canna indica TaxID=4628 RepID=A0AAQ3KUW8_9LILI|nr:protein SMG7 [Canna indica]
MTVPMDKPSAPSSRELAQRLFEKNTELENGLRRSAKSKVPSDPNSWLQMRENYETIILEDHDFSEEHDVEYVLWQLHYRRIEEFRQHINAAASAGSNASSGAKVSVRPDKLKKICYIFRSFLTEATGFYHDLLLKIRAKYGLPLSYSNEAVENEIALTKDEKNLSEMKKGLISCHRCLIYLGDLARYKGLYGEGDSVSRDYAAASSYYMQAAALCPFSGNPHHQLAILASYSADELLAIYRYFRSLAVEIPFATARDNLIIAFEKNRQIFSQLPGNTKAATGRRLPSRSAGRGRGRGDTKFLLKDAKAEATPTKYQDPTMSEVFKAFSTRFVRLHGILFTRTSLETFGEVFSSVMNDFNVLLSTGPEEELNFGSTAAENASMVLRLIAILIFTVHNVKRESENQSYAEILQRTVLLQNAFTAAFEFTGCIVKRCMELHDAASSYLLPGILLFVEWLACHPDFAAGFDVEEKQAGARSFFWNQYVPFMNRLIETGLASINGDKDEACFFNMSRYDEGETGNGLALWEDFELRGFLPLVPAHLILDFSRKHVYMNDGGRKEKISRIQRILAAGQALTNTVTVDQKKIFIDPSLKKFVLGTEPPVFENNLAPTFSSLLDSSITERISKMENAADLGAAARTSSFGMSQTEAQLYVGGEEEEEEIVFKPTTSEKYPDVSTSNLTAYDIVNPVPVSFVTDWTRHAQHLSSPSDGVQLSAVSNVGSKLPSSSTTSVSQLPLQHMNADNAGWFMKPESLLSDALKNMNITENGYLNMQILRDGSRNFQAEFPSSPFSAVFSPVSLDTNSMLPNQIKAADVVLPSALDTIVHSGTTSDGGAVKLSSALPSLKKNPVSRPDRHTGPPPGFSHTARQQDGMVSNSYTKEQMPKLDDYSWLDVSRSSSTKVIGLEKDQIRHVPYVTMNNAVPFKNASSFPFPGKQVSNAQTEVVNEPKWNDFQLFEQLKSYNGQKIQQSNPQYTLLPEQHQAQSLWSRRYFV